MPFRKATGGRSRSCLVTQRPTSVAPAIRVASGLARYQSASSSLSRGWKAPGGVCPRRGTPARGYLGQDEAASVFGHPVRHRGGFGGLGRADDRGIAGAAAEVAGQHVVMVGARRSDGPPPSRRRSPACRSRIGCRDGRPSPLHRVQAAVAGRRCLRPCAPPCRPVAAGTGCRRSARGCRPHRSPSPCRRRSRLRCSLPWCRTGRASSRSQSSSVRVGGSSATRTGVPFNRNAISVMSINPAAFSPFGAFCVPARCGVKRATRPMVRLGLSSSRAAGTWQAEPFGNRQAVSRFAESGAAFRRRCASARLRPCPAPPNSSTFASIPNIRCWKARCR